MTVRKLELLEDIPNENGDVNLKRGTIVKVKSIGPAKYGFWIDIIEPYKTCFFVPDSSTNAILKKIKKE